MRRLSNSWKIQLNFIITLWILKMHLGKAIETMRREGSGISRPHKSGTRKVFLNRDVEAHRAEKYLYGRVVRRSRFVPIRRRHCVIAFDAAELNYNHSASTRSSSRAVVIAKISSAEIAIFSQNIFPCSDLSGCISGCEEKIMKICICINNILSFFFCIYRQKNNKKIRFNWIYLK